MTELLTHAVLTDTQLVTYRHIPERDPRAHQALLDWLALHGLDPHRMPVENLIVRNLEACRIEYTEFVWDDERDRAALDAGGQPIVRRAYAQGETPPMPFPADLSDGRERTT